MKSLNGKIAVVTGASKGIGAALAITLAREGCDIILVARNKDGLMKTADEVKKTGKQALVISADVSNLKEIERIGNEIQSNFDRVDILYNGIGDDLEDDIFEADPERLAYSIQTVLIGNMCVTQKILPFMKESGGHVINVITDWAMPNTNGPSIFVAGKYGLKGFGQALSKEVIANGVKVTNILPGDTASEFGVDDQLELVTKKYGDKKISLADILAIILLCLKLESSKIDQVLISPINPEYHA